MIKEDVTHGPITIINISEFRCDALFIERHQVHWIALPHLGIANIGAKSQENDIERRKIRNWLWETITGPILSALEIT
ncbi:putative 30S ribosomal protein S17P-like protein [Ilyonectria robusta]